MLVTSDQININFSKTFILMPLHIVCNDRSPLMLIHHYQLKGVMMSKEEVLQAKYWRTNLIAIGILLLCWALPSLVLGIIFVEPLNAITFLGFPLGFWFAQQGSIVLFVIIILVYAIVMDKVDRNIEKEKEKI